MAFIDKMKEARIRKGLTQEKLAKEIGVAKSTYTGYEKGNSEPNMMILSRIMNVLDVDANFLFEDDAKEHKDHTATPYEMEHIIKKYRLLDPIWKEAVDNILNIGYQASTSTPQSEHPKQDKVIYIFPGYSVPMSAGAGQPAGDEYPENYRLVKEPPQWASFIAPISGDSMEPTYHDGDKLFIRACQEIEPGQIGVFFMDGQQWVKELGDGELISHNPDYPPRPITDDIRCQGLVLGVCDETYFE